MAQEISATDAARSFSTLLSRVRYAGESFVVVRNGEAMCRIEPVAAAPRSTVSDLVDLLERRSTRDAAFADDVATAQRKQPKLGRSPWDS